MNFSDIFPKILDKAKNDPTIDALWLYGSHAKGSATKNSDIDLAIIFSKFEQDIVKRRLRPEILAIDWQIEFNLPENSLSVLDMDIAPIPLAMGVLQTGKLLINKDPSHEFRSSGRIMSMWELDYQYHYKIFGH